LSQLEVESMPFELCKEFDKLILRIVTNTEVMEMEVDSTLLQDVQKGQLEDKKIKKIKHAIPRKRSHPDFQKMNKE
jgi:hypothetical protein